MTITPDERTLMDRHDADTELGWISGTLQRHAYLGHPLAKPSNAVALCGATVRADEQPDVDPPEDVTATCTRCWRAAVLIRTRREPPRETPPDPNDLVRPYVSRPGGHNRAAAD